MSVHIQLRRDTHANWTSTNPTLLLGEAGLETDTNQLKFGDGATAWTGLGYFSGAEADGLAGCVQFSDGMGGFVGSAYFAWSEASHRLTIDALDGAECFRLNSSLGSPMFSVIDAGGGEPLIVAGDFAGDFYHTRFLIDDASNSIQFASAGTIQFGDLDGVRNLSVVILDDVYQKTSSNVLHEASGDIEIMDTSWSLIQRSPDATRWRLHINNAGAVSAVLA